MPVASLGELIAEAVTTTVSQLDPELQARRREKRGEKRGEKIRQQRREQKEALGQTHKLGAPKTTHNTSREAANETNETNETNEPMCDTSGEAATNQRSAYSTPQVLTARARLKNSRYISACTKDAVRTRDHGRCSYTDPQTRSEERRVGKECRL